MPQEEKAMLSVRMASEEEKKCENDLLYFLKNYVKTIDEHDTVDPIKPLPMEKQYLQDMASLLLSEKLLLIEKSRQMLITWILCAYALWIAQFHEGRRVAIQSKKEADANAILDRCKFIYKQEPDFLKIKHKANEQMAYCKFEFGKQNSIITAIPQGSEQLRQYTFSLIVSDEMAFQEKNEEAYIAAMPTIKGGGQFIGASSPNFKEFFYRLSKDYL